MSNSDYAYDLIDHLYETSVDPERLFDLIRAWDAQIGARDPEIAVESDTLRGTPFARHLERAQAVLDEVHALEFRKLDDALAGISSAAMVLADTGTVVAANKPARVSLGMHPGGSIRLLSVPASERDDFANRVTAVALGCPRDDIVQLRPEGRPHPLLVHLRTLGEGTARRHALAVSSEQVWVEGASDVLMRVFALTGAEIALFRRLTEGESVADICRATGRSEGTVRSQLHSVLAKTGARTQLELARLATMLLHAVAFDPGPTRPADQGGLLALDANARHVRLSDGRKLAVLRFGDPAGRPIVWMHSGVGLFYPTRSAEVELRRRNLKVIVPVRAGYGASDPATPDRDPLDVTVSDVAELMGQAGIERCPVVAAWYEITAALMLAGRVPERVTQIVAIGAAFPIWRIEQFRRLEPAGRVFVACARYMPQALPFLVRAARARMLRTGLEAFLQANFRTSAADARAVAEPEIADAVISGFTRLYGDYGRPEDAFCAELVRCQRAWPKGLGDVGCPVTLIQGEQDGAAPHLTALDYRAIYPRWRYIGFPDAGQLVALAHWREVLDVIEDPALELPLPAVPAGALAAQ